MPRTRAGASSSAIATTASRAILSSTSRRRRPARACPAPSCATARALYDRLGPWFTLLRFGDADPSPLIDAAPVPLETVIVDDPAIAPIYEAKLVLVRPDTHVAWRGNACADGRAVWQKVLA